MGSIPQPGSPSSGPWTKTKRKREERRQYRRRVWILNTVELEPPPWRQRMAGRWAVVAERVGESPREREPMVTGVGGLGDCGSGDLGIWFR